jgi:hypothetical protein
LEQYEGDVKKGKPKWMLWVVIGIVAVVVVVVVVKLGGGGPSSASGLTLDELSAIANQQSTLIQGLSTWKATATEDLANLNTKQQQILSQLGGITNPKDWTSDMNKLKADFTTLQSSWSDALAGINITIPRYAMVSSMTEDDDAETGHPNIIMSIDVYGAGVYPVVVTFYGEDIGNSILLHPRYCDYTIKSALVSVFDASDNSTEVIQLVAFVMPDENGWDSVDTINLGIDLVDGASIDCAVAVVGCSWREPGESPDGDWQS